MQPTESRVDWEGVKECLATLHSTAPQFLGRSVVIGGAASWFYRVRLQSANDPDFRERTFGESEERFWLSKDIDFTGIFRGDAVDLLPTFVVHDGAGHSHLSVNGVRLGFAQVGVVFDPESVFARARVGAFELRGQKIQFLVIDPISLFREKQALAQKRNQPNDRLHLEVLREALTLEFVVACENYILRGRDSEPADQRRWLAFLLDVKAQALEILSDERIARRLRPSLQTNSEESRFIRIRILDEN